MNFITNLLKSKGKNVILIIIDRLNKERYYVLCSINENSSSVK